MNASVTLAVFAASGNARENFDPENDARDVDWIGFGDNLANLKGSITFAGVNGVGSTPAQLNKKNFGPRMGFAYQVNDRLVVRGGVGYVGSSRLRLRRRFFGEQAPAAADFEHPGPAEDACAVDRSVGDGHQRL